MSEYKALKGKKIKTFATDLVNEQAEGQVFFSTAAAQRELKTVVKQDSWAGGGNLNTARNELGGAGTQGATIAFGGATSPPTRVNNSEEYNGTSWTEIADMSTARYTLGGNGTTLASLAVGGLTPSITNATEEFTVATTALNVETLTTS